MTPAILFLFFFLMLQEDSAYRQFTTDYRNWCWYSSVSSIACNHDLSSLCFRRIQHTDNLPQIIGIGVGIQVCLLLLVIMIYLLYVLYVTAYRQFTTGGFSIQTIYH